MKQIANFLEPDKTTTVSVGDKTITIIHKVIPDNLRATKDVASYVRKGQPLKPCANIGPAGTPLGITVHNTNDIKVETGTNAAEQYCRATYNGNMAGVVVHYYVWHSEIWQLLRLDERGWHATDGKTRRKAQRPGQQLGGNLDTIAVEAIGPDEETENTTAILCAWLCQEFGLDPMQDIYQHHYFYSAKNCPLYIRSHWAQFLATVAGYMKPEKRVIEQSIENSNDLRIGDRVRIKQTGIPYYPGAKEIPSWVANIIHTVDSTLITKGGKQCLRLREITTFCDVENLENE